MANPFTQESRDVRMSLGLDGVVDKLRVPDSIEQLVRFAKPLHMPNGDFFIKAALDQHLMTCIIRSDYAQVYETLSTLFGAEVTTVTRKPLAKLPVTDGTTGAKRHAAADEC